jgi:beta-mannanase
VKFVWNVNGTSVSDIPHDPHNTIESYWPGDAYVDYVSIDAYNWGLHTPGVTKWQSANAIFGHAYRSVTALTDKPLFIAETGCSDKGGDKAAWIADFYSQMGARFPRVTGVCWFDTDKEEDWRIEQTPATLAAIQQVVRDGY